MAVIDDKNDRLKDTYGAVYATDPYSGPVLICRDILINLKKKEGYDTMSSFGTISFALPLRFRPLIESDIFPADTLS